MTERDDLLAVAMRCCAERKLSARINVGTVAHIVGCTEEDVTLLMQANLLKPLGKPGQNSVKWFACLEIMLLAADRKWLDDVTKTLSQYWRRKRARRSASADLENGPQQDGPKSKIAAQP
jgi:hypothetical protein